MSRLARLSRSRRLLGGQEVSQQLQEHLGGFRRALTPSSFTSMATRHTSSSAALCSTVHTSPLLHAGSLGATRHDEYHAAGTDIRRHAPSTSRRPLSSVAAAGVPTDEATTTTTTGAATTAAPTSTATPSTTTIGLPETQDPEVLLPQLGMTAHDLWGWAARTPTPLRLADMYQYAANPDFRIPNAVFLHTELPIRVAQRAVDLLTLPFGLSEAPPIRAVASTYIRYLHTILATPPPQTRAQEAHFTDVLQSLVLDRASIPQAIAQGLGIWKAHTTAASTTEDDHAARYHEMEEALYRFFTARVGLRFLTEHHVLSSQRNTAASDALRSSTLTRGLEPDAADTVDTVGCIQAHVDLAKEVRRVVAVVQEQFEQSGAQRVPPVEIVDCPSSCTDDDGFTYVPHHLHYMLLELLKNSVRATLREYDLHEELPPIRIVLVKGAEDVTIKVADKAGGIPRSRMAQIWQFCHSTVVDDDGHSGRPPSDASGTQLRGFGLPICRIYARYFGGELTLKSVEGYGLDAYLHLPRLGKSGEHLPPRVRASPGELDSLPTGWAGRTASTSSTSSTSSSSVGTASGSSTTQRHYSSAVALEQAWDRQEDVIRKRLRALFR